MDILKCVFLVTNINGNTPDTQKTINPKLKSWALCLFISAYILDIMADTLKVFSNITLNQWVKMDGR